MTHLSESLKKHYRREKNRLIFQNGQTLNQFALTMWEYMNFQGLDSSVLSRVLAGERLFTVDQLDIFSNILNLSRTEKEELEMSLYLDRLKRTKIKLPLSLNLNLDLIDLFEELLEKASNYRILGKTHEQKDLAEIVIDSIEKSLMSAKDSIFRNKLFKQLAIALQLKGHAVGALEQPNTIVKNMLYTIKKLRKIASQTKQLYYANVGRMLFISAQYVSVNYYSRPGNQSVLSHSIKFARQTYEAFEDDDPNKLFALRTAIASSIHLRDKETFLSMKKLSLKLLPQLPIKPHFLNGIFLYNAVAKGSAIFGQTDALEIKSNTLKHFGLSLDGRPIDEVSELRSDLEMFLALRTKNKLFLQQKTKKVLDICSEKQYKRHYESISHLAKMLFN